MENNKVTPVGRYIRKLGLDELPQLLNIIKNEMAFIGPRPLTSADIKRLNCAVNYNERWTVKPGITGMGQLTKTCNADLSMKNDLFYVKNKSLALDCKIIGKSLLVPFLGKRTK